MIGGGAAGLSAALYASRKGLSTVLISEDVGGQVGVTRDIYNYPGYEYVTGPELSERMIGQLSHNPVEQLLGEYVTGLRLDGRCKVVELESDREVRADAVIIASGVTKRRLEVPGEEELEGLGVVYCSTCDGPLYRDKTVAVVGAGNSAFEAALEMNGIARKVYLVTRGLVGADQVLRDKVATAKRVEHLQGQLPVEVHGAEEDGGVDGLTIADRRSGEQRRLTSTPCSSRRGCCPTPASPSTWWRPTRMARSSSTNAGAPACAACSPPATAPRCPTSRSWWRPATAPRRRSPPSSTSSASAERHAAA